MRDEGAAGTTPATEPAELEIHPLTPERWDDLAALFRESGDPRWCWCMYWRLRAKDFSANTVAQNREAFSMLVQGERAPGLLAYVNGRPVGWVSLAPRRDFERLERSRRLVRVDDTPVWSIVCFAVSRHHRGEGIARALLRAAIDFARANGAPALEAYPADPGEERISPSGAYRGTLAMFRAAGFHEVRRTSAVTGGAQSVIVRLDLAT